MTSNGRRLDQWVATDSTGPIDLGWGIATINPVNRTVTRRCKMCRASATSRYQLRADSRGVEVLEVVPVPFYHDDGCPMFDHLGNNPGLS